MTVTGATPAVAEPGDPPGPAASLDPAAKVSSALQEAEGSVTAFVQLAAPSALDVVEEGGDAAEAQAAAADVEALAEEVVPSRLTARSLQSDAPQRQSVTSRLVSGTVVVGDAQRVRDLADSEDVVAVYLVPLQEPTNASADTFTRAVETWRSLGETGEGIRMGIIDTGVDYTHAAFGGPGTPEAYAAAYGEDGTGPIPESTFDGAKFLGGWDFAGPDYHAGGTPAQQVPQPDPNPIDAPHTAGGGHGSHVAGTAAGYGVTAEGETFRGDYAELEDIGDWQVGPGSAPEAGIYALKVFGDIGGSTGLTINALEWAADPDGDFDFNDRLDVVNLSLGASGAPVDNPQSLFVERLADLGTLSVMSAGNSADATDVGGSPGSSAGALTVANSLADAMTFDAVEVTAASDESLIGLHPAQNTVEYTGSEDVEAPVVYLGDGVDGCQPLTPFADQIAGNIVWLHWDDNSATRACGSGARWANATAAGAAGVLIGTQQPVFSAGIAGDADTPGAQLTANATDELLPEVQAGTLTVRLGPSYAAAVVAADDAVADTLNPGSSRGAHGSLGIVKPDVAAPGTRIHSAASGSGADGVTYTGTSMSAPHVAGIAALVRAARPSWEPREVKAVIMNTATHDVHRLIEGTPVFGPERVGSGRVDAYDAVTTGVIAYDSSAEDLVSVTFGVVDVGAETVTLRRTVTVENLDGTEAVRFDARFEPATTMGAGASITTSPASVTVAPGGRQTVTLTLTADPAELVRKIDPTQDAISAVGVPREYVAAISGRLVLEQREAEPSTLHVPVHAAPRLVSDLTAEPVELADGQALTAPLGITGRHVDSGGWTSLVSVLELMATSPRLAPADPAQTSPTQVAAGDIRYVGALSTAHDATAEDPGYVGIGIAVEGDWPTLGGSTLPVIVTDVDSDGVPDYRTVVQKYNVETDVTLAATFDLRTGAAVALQAVNGVWGSVDTTVYDNNVLVAPIPLRLFDPGATPTFEVFTSSSYAPDGTGIVDRVEPFRYDPFAPDVWTTGGGAHSIWAPSDAELTLHRSPDAGPEVGPLLVLHSHNPSGERAQVVEVAVPELVAEPTTTALTVDGEAVPGGELTLTATVAPAGATGSVTFRDGESELATVDVADGRASTVATLGAGSHELTAAYTPDTGAWEASVSEPVTVEIGASASTTTLRLSRTLTTYGTPAQATVTVEGASAAPSGTVEIHRGGEVVASGELTVDGRRGTATLDLPAGLPSGAHRLTAVYAGTEAVAGSESRSATYVVLPALPRVDIDAEPTVRRGTAPEVDVSVLGRGDAPAPTGTVTVTAGLRVVERATLDEGGTVSVQLPPVGLVTVVTATYGGDHGYLPGLDLTTIRGR